MQPATINGSAFTQGHTLLIGEARKLSTHEAACTAVGVPFVPIVKESLGGMSAPAVNTLAGIGRLLDQRLGISTLTQFDTCSKGHSLEGKCRHVVTPVSDLFSLHIWSFLTFPDDVYGMVWSTGIHLFIYYIFIIYLFCLV